MPKVSVIVPVYNVENYLSKCLNSLVNQTLKDIEVIVVNDGSPDDSQKIIDKYVKKYPKKIKSYIKENGGLSDARNYGLKYASGEYISFVDSDDWVDFTLYEKLYNKAIECDFDVVACDVYSIDETGVKKIINSGIKKEIFTKEEIKNQMIDIYPVAWNKTYRKDLLNDSKIKFKKKIWFEDVEFLYRLFPFIKSIGVVNEPLNYYLQRTGTISKTYDERLLNYIENWNGIIEFYKKNKLYEHYKNELEYCYTRYVIGVMIKNAYNYKDKMFFYHTVDNAFNNLKKQFPKYRKNKYLKTSFKGFLLLIVNPFILKMLYKIKNN